MLCMHWIALKYFHLLLDRTWITRSVLRIGLDRGHPPTPPQNKALGYSWLLTSIQKKKKKKLNILTPDSILQSRFVSGLNLLLYIWRWAGCITCVMCYSSLSLNSFSQDCFWKRWPWWPHLPSCLLHLCWHKCSTFKSIHLLHMAHLIATQTLAMAQRRGSTGWRASEKKANLCIFSISGCP